MWTNLLIIRWIFLLSVAVAMIVSSTEVAQPCCLQVSSKKVPVVRECFEQVPRIGCNQSAFIVSMKVGGRRLCINSTAEWLLEKIEQKKVVCIPI